MESPHWNALLILSWSNYGTACNLGLLKIGNAAPRVGQFQQYLLCNMYDAHHVSETPGRLGTAKSQPGKGDTGFPAPALRKIHACNRWNRLGRQQIPLFQGQYVGPIQLYLVKIAEAGSRCPSIPDQGAAYFFGTAFVIHVDCMCTK